MRLKEIKPGMAIHCKNDKEMKALLGEAHRLGYCWADGTSTNRVCCPGNATIKFHPEGILRKYKHITWGEEKEGTEFSDLILPELTAEEVLQICNEICSSTLTCGHCTMVGNCFNDNYSDYSKVVEICEKWKTDHEKKEPEIETEWFWQGRILKINEDDCYCQINDGTVFYDTGCEYRESAEEYMKDELKEYCKTHEGEFIAVVEHVCRVKAVE